MREVLCLLARTKKSPRSVRFNPELEDDIETMASFLGLSFSGYVHSVMTQQIRKERETRPEAFESSPQGIEQGGSIILSAPEKNRKSGSDK